ncbi:ABC transporter permease [[Eubacterium] cellulosolvens]
MNLIELFKLSFGALNERKVRSGLTVLMVIIGVALMTSLNGLGAGMNSFIDEQLGTLGANILIITPSEAGAAFGPPTNAPETKLTSQTVQTIERVHGVEYVVPYYTGTVTMRSSGEEKTVTIRGIDMSKTEYIAPKSELESGSLVSITDSIGMVLGYYIAYPSNLDKPLAKRGQTVNVEYTIVESEGGREKLTVEKKSFQVKGIFKETGNMNFDNFAYISPSAANALLNKEGAYDGIFVITRGADDNDAVEERIRKIYGKNLGIISPKALAETIKDVMAQFTGFIGAVALVSMFVGAVGIITTLYTSVMERTREIGLLKAIGYGNRTILIMFLTESIAIGLIGAILGLLTGVAGAYALVQIIMQTDPEAQASAQSGSPVSMSPVFRPTDVFQVFLLAFILSIIAGLYPAWRASRLSPITALRKE